MLVRLRVDPERVRVSIVRTHDGYYVTVAARTGRLRGGAWSDDPAEAVELALENGSHVPGVDLECDWAYDHPWK